MVAVEHGHLAQGQAFVAKLEDLLGEEVGFLVGVGRGDDQRLDPFPSRRDQGLGEARGVVRDRGVGEGDDLGRSSGSWSRAGRSMCRGCARGT